MTGKKTRAQEALDRLEDALVEDILNAPDEDILAEFAEEGGDAERHAAEMRALVDRSVIAANKGRMRAAKAGAAAARGGAAQNRAPADIAAARAKLRRALALSPAAAQLTMAARKESELSDADVLGLLDDLDTLGVTVPDADDDGNA
jgi:hypothetical protein